MNTKKYIAVYIKMFMKMICLCSCSCMLMLMPILMLMFMFAFVFRVRAHAHAHARDHVHILHSVVPVPAFIPEFRVVFCLGYRGILHTKFREIRQK
jgi:hypothetical protein